MGGVTVWCMHFIANCAIVLGNKEPDLQIVYNSTFTAISFFVPIVVLLAAFMLIGANETVSFVRLVPGGALAGLAICGMHYLGHPRCQDASRLAIFLFLLAPAESIPLPHHIYIVASSS